MTNKLLYALCAVGLLAVSCQEELKSPTEISYKNVRIEASVSDNADTKATETDARFAWAAGDAISIWTNTGSEYSFVELSNEREGATALFEGILEGDNPIFESYAVYPSGEHAVTGSALSINMPAEYGDIETELGNNVNSPMVAAIEAPVEAFNCADFKLVFKHAGGLIRLTVNNVPANTDEFVFISDKDITGVFSYDDASQQITQGEANTGNNKVSIKFAPSELRTNRVFYIPLPVGDYSDFSIELKGAGEVIKSAALKGKALGRAVLAAKTVTLTAIPGEIEGSDLEGQLRAAIAASSVENPATFVLTGDISVDKAFLIGDGQSITVDLNGYSIKAKSALSPIEGANANESKKGIFYVVRGGELNLVGEGSVDVDGISSIYAAVRLGDPILDADKDESKVAKLSVDGPTLKGYWYAVSGNGSLPGTLIDVKGGKLCAYEARSLGIYHPQDGVINISGGEIIGGDSAIEMRAGTLNVSGGTLTSTATEFSAVPNGSGSTIVGATIAISQHNTNKPIAVNITGGTISGPCYAIYEEDLQDEASDNISIKIQKKSSSTQCVVDGKIYSENCTEFVNGATYTDLTASKYINKTFKVQNILFDIQEDIVLDECIDFKDVNSSYAIEFKLGDHIITNNIDIWSDSVLEKTWGLFHIGNANVIINADNGGVVAKANDAYAFALQGTKAKLTINGGKHIGNISAVYVYDGTLNITGGEFDIIQKNTPTADDPLGYRYLINCKDENYAVGTAKVNINGGKFHGWNPSNNLAEGPATNFCKAGYAGVYDSANDIYEVDRTPEQIEIDALNNVLLKGGKHVLSMNIEVGKLSVNKAAEIDLNGYTITITDGTKVRLAGNSYMYCGIYSSALPSTLTISDGSAAKTGAIVNSIVPETGNYAVIAYLREYDLVINGGSFTSSHQSVWVANGNTATINGGTFNVTTHNECIYNQKGNIYIHGGSFEAASCQYLINNLDSAASTNVISIDGGSFKNFNPACHNVDGPDAPTSFIASGYEVECDGAVATSAHSGSEDKWYSVVAK